jgi:hypothetical protein
MELDDTFLPGWRSPYGAGYALSGTTVYRRQETPWP